MLARLIEKHDVVLLQETHGNESDLQSIRHKFTEHIVRGSFCDSARAGGLLFVVSKDFAKNYDDDEGTLHRRLRLVNIVPGRIAKIIFPGNAKLFTFEVINVHIEVDLNSSDAGYFVAKTIMLTQLAGTVAPRAEVHTMIAGDFNATTSDEPRFNPVEGTLHLDNSSAAKRLEAILSDFTELHQPHFTKRTTSGGIIVNLSRIDRVYSNCPTCELIDRRPIVATVGLVAATTGPSDHVPVSASIFAPWTTPPAHPTVPPWVLKHPFFPTAAADLWRLVRNRTVDPMVKMQLAKGILHAAAVATKKQAGLVGASTVPEKLHWAMLAFRGRRLGEAGAHLCRRAVAAFPALRPLLPDSNDAGDHHLLSDLIADLAAKSINIDITEVQGDTGQPGSRAKAKVAQLHALAATWRSHRRRLSLAAVIDDDGHPQANTQDSAKLLCDFWKPVFRERHIEATAALEVMKHIVPVPPDIPWRLDRVQFREMVARPRVGAPGPDGLPYAAWRVGGTVFMDILFDAYEAFLGGAPLPDGFNDCLLVFIPKGEDIHDQNIIARTPGLTRPISLSNTASKFFALAINRPLAMVARVSVHPRQRGFVGGRSLTDNIIEIEGYAQSYVIAEATDPAILLFDIKAAFPSLAHQWLFVMLGRMRVPRFITNAIKALYRDGFAEIVLAGSRWDRFPVRSGIRQGCPASGTLFALAIDPCFRYILTKFGPKRGVVTAYADDIAAAVRELYEAIGILDKAFSVVAECSALELHPGKVIMIPLWKFVESEVRIAVAAVAPRFAAAKIQDFGKLLGLFVGPGAATRQWTHLQEELKTRSRYLASLNLAWSGALPMYRSHVLPVVGHVAALAPIPKEVFATEAGCYSIILKTPAHAVPSQVLHQLRAYGGDMDVPDIRSMGRAASFRCAAASLVLADVTREIRRARSSREVNISPFLTEWTRKGVVGHLIDTTADVSSCLSSVCPDGRGVQKWITQEIRKQWTLVAVDRAVANRLSMLAGRPISSEVAGLVRVRVLSLRKTMPPVVLSSVIRSVCNAWTTTGRFGGPTLACPFACGTEVGDRWSHFPGCSSIRRMWADACPSSDTLVLNMTLEAALLLTPELPNEVVPQVALWTDVVGHCANDIRSQGISPAQVRRGSGGMFAARLRQLALQSDSARAVISSIRASSLA